MSITEQLQDKKVLKQLQEYGIIHLRIFGSQAKNSAQKNSDIDLLYDIDYSRPYSGRGPISALGFLEQLFQKKVDLININNIHPLLEAEIHSSKISIF